MGDAHCLSYLTGGHLKSSFRRLAVVGFALVVLIGLAACEPEPEPLDDRPADNDEEADGDGDFIAGEPDDDEDVVTVGLLHPLTGPYATVGEEVNDGVALYLDESDGELGEYNANVLVEDETNDPETARENTERLVELGGVDVVLGFANSRVAYDASSYLVDEGIPLMITVAGADDLTQRNAAETVYRVSYSSSQEAMPMGAYACEELGYRTVSIIALDYAFGWEAAGGFARAYTDAGCEVVQETYVPLDEEDWAPFVQRIDEDVDAVWAATSGPDSIRFVQAYRDVGVGHPLIGTGGLTDEEVLAQQRSIAEDIVTSSTYSPALDSPENAEFVAVFEEAYGRAPSRYAESGYAAAMMLDEALAGASRASPATITDALRDVAVDAPRGPLHFDEYGQAVHHVYVRRVEELAGEWRNTVIEDLGETTQFWTYDPDEYLDDPPYEDLRETWPGL